MEAKRDNGKEDHGEGIPVEDWIDIEEAAEVTGYSIHTLRKYAKQGEVPCFQRKKGSPFRFRRSELLRWATPKRRVSGSNAA